MQVLDYLEEMFPGDHDLHVSILLVSPKILGRPVDTFLRPTVEFLNGHYGADLFIEAIRRNQDLLLTRGLGYNAGPSSDSVSAFLQEEMKLSPMAVSKIKQKEPQLFQQPLHKTTAVVSFIDGILQQGNVTAPAIQTTMTKLLLGIQDSSTCPSLRS